MTSGDRLRIEVLGPIRVFDAAGRDITPPGVLQRRLLALLVLRRGQVVSVDSIAEALWPSKLPRDPAAALQNHVFRLRRGLPDGLIESVGDGYRLDPAGVEVDADDLSAALGDGATTDAAVLAQIDAALERWQGVAYPELDEVDEGRADARRLDELRWRAREMRAEARLAVGDTDGLVAGLRALADEQPLRERPRSLLMTALATTGRAPEALRVYDEFRRLLGDEMGIEPSPALMAQHAGLLAGTSVASWAPTNRLPVPATSLVGRDDLAAEVTAVAEAERLVTLVGPGGVGKTRLLVEIGHRLLATRPDRPVVLCEVASVDAASVVDAVAASLGIDARPGTPPAERVVDVLGGSEIVLLLDNCEHVLEPVAGLVAALLGGCANVRVVATSRERLRVSGEHVRTVPTLPTMPSGTEAPPAVQLFVERARAVAPGFRPGAHEVERVAEIVRRLDGLPLAIELAAARLHTHDVEEIAAGLDQRFTLLSSGYRTSTRHGSLRAAVSWSFGLLDDDLQGRFADLAVFVGSFTAVDAAAVCGTDVATVTVALAQLVERSLVMRAPERRYVLLESLRAFGAEQLAASGRADVVGARHAHHLVDWAERAPRRMLEPGEPVLAEIDAAIPELRNGLGWLIDHSQAEPAGRLVAGLIGYALLRLRPDVLAWSERVLEIDPDDLSPVASRVWAVAAYARWMAGGVVESAERSAHALGLAERSGGDIPPEVLTFRGNCELFEGRVAQAATWYRRSSEAAGAADPVFRLVAASSELLALGYASDPGAEAAADALLAEIADDVTPQAAYVWYCAGEADLGVDEARARRRFVEALRLAELTHASFVTGLAGASKASIDARSGDPAVAAADFRRLILHWQRAGMWSTQWTMLRSIAWLLARVGQHHDAAVLEGAVRATAGGHRIFGADEIALAEMAARLRAALGADTYEAARRQGAVLDGDAAVEHALHALQDIASTATSP